MVHLPPLGSSLVEVEHGASDQAEVAEVHADDFVALHMERYNT